MRRILGSALVLLACPTLTHQEQPTQDGINLYSGHPDVTIHYRCGKMEGTITFSGHTYPVELLRSPPGKEPVPTDRTKTQVKK